MTVPARPLPALLHEISELVGKNTALALADQFGGTRIYIPLPENLKINHPLVLCVGMVAAKKIAKQYSREQITIPLARELLASQIAREIETGSTVAQIARRLGTTERNVWRIKARAVDKSDRAQSDLFESPQAAKR